ncbi:MAG: 4Fe-4S dicluster domain-containing protein [Candidatus Omnitrophica bacterium]|nr:4Fe-4S dicluster domain-containing protein [Candidatus Omnitrophota bacterium]MDD5352510.1 4Fe-4S dicluster domain-containing protein [Candidatus Omnitrophota bacterium]MDD5550108.1 4Fe-4S dicluster domain-containing protein [Candidatus Omnitrophota bacterium]
MEKPKKLFVDLDICSTACQKCVVDCSYFYHPENNGMYSLRELITYVLICRKCEEPHCVNSCPQNALEKQQDKILRRYYMRCIGCKSCVHACPYGTIYPELVPYITSKCDLCLDRRKQKDQPICVPTCPYGALSLNDTEPNEEKHIYSVTDNIVAHSTHWIREKA